MRKLMVVIVLVLVSAVALAQSAGNQHTSISGTVNVTDTGYFNWFSIVNQGPGDLVVHWYRQGSVVDGRTQPVPAGTSYESPVWTASMSGYRLVVTGTTTCTTSYGMAAQ